MHMADWFRQFWAKPQKKKKKKKKKKIDICSFKVDTPGSIKQLDDCFW